jgi:hypothetical protein
VAYDWVIDWIDDFLSSSLCSYLFVGAIIFAGLELAVQVVQSSSDGDGAAALPSDVGIIGMLGYEADKMFEWGKKHPVALLSLNFGIAFAVGTFVLFLKDMTDWWEARQIAAQDEKRQKTGYQRLSEADEGEVQRVLRELRAEAQAHALNLASFLKPFDKTHRGSVTTSRFVRQLLTQFRRINARDAAVLCRAFKLGDEVELGFFKTSR